MSDWVILGLAVVASLFILILVSMLLTHRQKTIAFMCEKEKFAEIKKEGTDD